MKVLDLFSGIGGFALGLERAGMKTVAFCEIEPYCREVLRRHWPEVPIHDDVRTLSGEQYRGVDIIAGGFPCQDASVAGKGGGLAGERTGLWREFHRLVAECRPRWVLAENVPGLRTRGADRVLSDLETLGYTARPLVVGAWAVGAPHRRDRVWIVADRLGDPVWQQQQRQSGGRAGALCDGGEAEHRGDGAAMADRNGWRRNGERQPDGRARCETHDEGASGHESDGRDSEAMGHSAGRGFGKCGGARHEGDSRDTDGTRSPMGDANRGRRHKRDEGFRAIPVDHEAGVGDTSGSGSQERHLADLASRPRYAAGQHPRWPAGPGPYQHEWEPPRVLPRTQSGMGSDVDGLPERLVPRERREALRALGNAVVPQVVEAIGRAIMRAA